MANAAPDPFVGLVSCYDDLRAVEDGLNGFLGIVANNKNKQIRIGRDAFYYAISPLVDKLTAANQQLDQVRERVRLSRGFT